MCSSDLPACRAELENRNFETPGNAAYARLKNLTLGYTLPQRITRKFAVENLRVFVSLENLWTITNFTKMSDPELIDANNNWGFGKAYPLSKTVSGGSAAHDGAYREGPFS